MVGPIKDVHISGQYVTVHIGCYYLNFWRYHGTDMGITFARLCPITPVQAVPPLVMPRTPFVPLTAGPLLAPPTTFNFLKEAQIDPEEVPAPQ